MNALGRIHDPATGKVYGGWAAVRRACARSVRHAADTATQEAGGIVSMPLYVEDSDNNVYTLKMRLALLDGVAANSAPSPLISSGWSPPFGGSSMPRNARPNRIDATCANGGP